MICPLLKTSSLALRALSNYWPVSDLPFDGEFLECPVVLQLQRFLKETDYLDPFHLSFRPCFGIETTLLTLVDDLMRF